MNNEAAKISMAADEVLHDFARNLVSVLTEARSQLIAQVTMLRETIVDNDSMHWLVLNDQHLQSWDFPLADITFEQAVKRAALDSGFLALAGYAELTIESREQRDIEASKLLERCDAELQREAALRGAERAKRRLEKKTAKAAGKTS